MTAIQQTSEPGTLLLASILPHSDRELILSRVIDAPRAKVFDVWTTRLPQWWGPHGMITTAWHMDLRPGGAFSMVMRAPDGVEYVTRGIFLEITEPERIVFTDAFETGWRPHPRAFFTAVVTFEEFAGRTRCVTRALHWSMENRCEHERMGFREGWGESLDRLAALAMSV